MSSLACVAAEVNESTSSAFLIAFQQHSTAVGFFKPIAEHLRVKMKAVRYTAIQKVQTLVASILLGCPYTSSINHRLVPDQVAAREWGMERFPDQSQINLFLNRMTAENLAQLEQAHQNLLRAHSLLRSAPQVVVDIDQTGLRVTGKTFEFAEKGYFPRRRGARGYQLSAVLASAEGSEPEAIACQLDPGNVVGPARLPDLLRATLDALEQRGPQLVIRLDAGYGVSHASLDALLEVGVGFVLKWRDPRVARKIVREHQLQWQRHTKDVRVADGPLYQNVRSVICEVKGELTMLLTNLDRAPTSLFDFYNQRQTIEAFFKASKHVFGMANLRSRRFLAIAAFLGFVFLTHNFLVWTKAALFAGTTLVAVHTRWMVEKVISVPASLVRHGGGFRLELPGVGVLARQLRDALCPAAVQLPLPYYSRL
jgi:hypothetical protein